MLSDEKKYNLNVDRVISLSEEDIGDLVCSALEGGIGYWAVLDNSVLDYQDIPHYISLSEWTAMLLIDGKSVYFLDAEDPNEVWELTLDKLFKGIRLYVDNGHDHYGVFNASEVDMGNCDAECADCVFQYALFGELVYG